MSVVSTEATPATSGEARAGMQLRLGVVLASGLVGAVAWSGLPWALALSCLAPPLLIAAPARRDVAMRAAAYFLGATWPIVPAAAVFFGANAGGLRGALLGGSFWIAVSALNVLPWILFSPARAPGRVASVLLGLGLAAVPPLALLGLASPLAGLGWWLPGSGVCGIALYMAVLGVFVATPRSNVRWAVTGVVMLAVAGTHAVSAARTTGTEVWQSVSTSRGPAGPFGDADAVEALRRASSASGARVLVFPESHFARWSASNDAFLRPLWRELVARDQMVIFGVRRPNAATGLVDSLVLIRGRESGEYAQHLPVPVSMYRLGEAGSVPLHWRAPYTKTIAGERVGLLICWEQLLVAPMLGLALKSPDRLVGLSNLYFARGTPVAAIQAAVLRSWARLYGVPWVHAVNE